MQTQAAISAANGLLHSIEAALPKQKKVLAASEFKQAMVAQRRRRKVQPMVEGSFNLTFLFNEKGHYRHLVLSVWNTFLSNPAD